MYYLHGSCVVAKYKKLALIITPRKCPMKEIHLYLSKLDRNWPEQEECYLVLLSLNTRIKKLKTKAS